MKRIANWTFGAFFRTIGRTLAFILFGFLLAILFSKLDIKLPFLNVKAYTFTDNNNVVNLSLPNNDEYFIIDKYIYSASRNIYSYISSPTEFYYVCNYDYQNQNTYSSCVARNYMIEVSESVFNNSTEYKYLDHVTNKYYIFTGNDGFDYWYYNIENRSWVHASGVGDSILSTPNINTYNYDWRGNGLANHYDGMIQSPYNATAYTVTFHLEGGTATWNEPGFIGPPQILTGNFQENFYTNGDLSDYIQYLRVTNDIARFNQWYYDEALTRPYNENDIISSNLDLYASYEYTSIDSIISNIDFNEFTFPSDKQYAVISVKENFSQGLYIGLGFNFQYLTAYTYIIENQAFTNGAGISLNSIGSKNSYYYYHLGQLSDDDAKVIVIDKADLTRLGVDDVIEHYYTFRLSSNCYIEFTNDLTQVSYYIPSNGSSTKLENQDISSNVDYTHQIIIDSNSDIITIFMNSIKERNMNIFGAFKTIWYKFRAIRITSYLLIITFGAIIIALIKGGSRH